MLSTVPIGRREMDNVNMEPPSTTLEARILALGTQHVRPLQLIASDFRANSDAIVHQDGQIKIAVTELKGEASLMQKEVDLGNENLKELADVLNWAEALHQDLCMLEDTVRWAEGEHSGTEEESETDSDEETDSEDGGIEEEMQTQVDRQQTVG